MDNSIILSRVTSAITSLVKTEVKTTKLVNKVDNAIQVGELTVSSTDNNVNVIKNEKIIDQFENKIIAFEYARNYPLTFTKVHYLHSLDHIISRIKQQAYTHIHNIKIHKKSHDYFQVELHENLLSECKFKINQCIASASKYCKSNF